MRSQWYELKPKAVDLRKEGFSIRNIEKTLMVPRSTLSGWLKDIKLDSTQKQHLEKSRHEALAKGRVKAVLWHRNQKALRIAEAKEKATEVLESLDLSQRNILELALSMLYLGEGFKSSHTGMGSSSPLILKFFIKSVVQIYNLQIEKIKCELHLRADQKPREMLEYWSKELKVPLKNFTCVSLDIRTKGSPTYSYYKGVCVVQCGSVAIQRRLMHLAESFCEKISFL